MINTTFVKQTGVLFDGIQPNDYIMGGITGVFAKDILESGDWTSKVSTPEKQYKDYTFDTLSCVTFSALNDCEAMGNLYIELGSLSESQLKFLKDNNYFDPDGKLNFSDRFTAMMSGTTTSGNYFTKVWDSIRNDGLIPDIMLPFGGNSFAEYHDKTKITPTMIALGKEFLKHFGAKYQWAYSDNDPHFSDFEEQKYITLLKQSPLHIGTPIPASHAILAIKYEKPNKLSYLDQYPPFFNKFEGENIYVNFALQGILFPLSSEFLYTFNYDLKYKMIHPDVIMLQKALNRDIATQVAITGSGSPGKETSYFGEKTLAAVKRFQQKYGVNPISGYFGPLTRAKMNEISSK